MSIWSASPNYEYRVLILDVKLIDAPRVALHRVVRGILFASSTCENALYLH